MFGSIKIKNEERHRKSVASFDEVSKISPKKEGILKNERGSILDYSPGGLVGAFVTGAVLLTFAATYGYNRCWNNRVIKTEGICSVSRPTGVLGHVEHTKYYDGSEDVKIYPGWLGHRLVGSKLLQNLDGDNTVDRIRVDGPEWKMHRLTKILIREKDYPKNGREFDEADRTLVDERIRADKRMNK